MDNLRTAKITDPERIRGYLSDESAAFHGHADEVYLPANEAELAEVVRAANKSRTLLTVSAGGTSITGSRVPMCGGAVVSVERMTAVGAGSRPALAEPQPGFEPVEGHGFTILLNRSEKLAIVPPAITLAALDAALARFGLLYPPDPTEMSAMIGGTIATNASGARSFHYGPTRAWVRRLRVVLPTGELAELRRGGPRAIDSVLRFETNTGAVDVPLPAPGEYSMPHTKNAAGLYLEPGMESIDLFIGSEGLLGIITEAEVALVDRPMQTLTVVSYFGTRDGALGFVDSGVVALASRPCLHAQACPERSRRDGRATHGQDGRATDDRTRPEMMLQSPERFRFLSLEYFDHRSLDFMRPKYADIPEGAAAAVLFELPYDESEPHNPYPPSGLLSSLEDSLARHGALSNWAVAASRRVDLRLFRHSLPEAVNEFVRTRAGKIGSDMAVPHERLREMMDAYEREAGSSGVRFLMFGHIGDDHVHLNFLPEDQDAARRAKLAYSRLARTAVALGGTISAEHGVGKKTIIDETGRSAPYLEVLYGASGLRAIANVKNALDPNRILNIGNMVPAEMLD